MDLATIAAFAAGLAWGVLIGAGYLRRRPEPAINVAPETITRAIVASGGVSVHLDPRIIVDWSVIHQAVEGAGYQLVAKAEPGPARKH